MSYWCLRIIWMLYFGNDATLRSTRTLKMQGVRTTRGIVCLARVQVHTYTQVHKMFPGCKVFPRNRRLDFLSFPTEGSCGFLHFTILSPTPTPTILVQVSHLRQTTIIHSLMFDLYCSLIECLLLNHMLGEYLLPLFLFNKLERGSKVWTSGVVLKILLQ